ncbi:hypothetical protein KEM54_006372 [Ascosphaera aggregata]|nr:hypothetical protein KEM54_006372 [Ascosphaera aggregata]
MATSNTTISSAAVFQATYTGPEQPEIPSSTASNQRQVEKNFIHELKKSILAPSTTGSSALQSSDRVACKVAYLNELRELVPQMQADINTFLTARMDADKAALGGGENAEDRKKEEEEEAKYGEENVEDDDM